MSGKRKNKRKRKKNFFNRIQEKINKFCAGILKFINNQIELIKNIKFTKENFWSLLFIILFNVFVLFFLVFMIFGTVKRVFCYVVFTEDYFNSSFYIGDNREKFARTYVKVIKPSEYIYLGSTYSHYDDSSGEPVNDSDLCDETYYVSFVRTFVIFCENPRTGEKYRKFIDLYSYNSMTGVMRTSVGTFGPPEKYATDDDEDEDE